MRISVNMNAADLRMENSTDDLIEMVQELDCEIGDWGFTLKLAEYFAKQHKECHDDGGVGSDCEVCAVLKKVA